ncbi:MAG: phospholipase effector Tle1 domain-containing protein, partial [Flavobacteriaceae bacterium]
MKYSDKFTGVILGIQFIFLCLIFNSCNTRKGIIHNPVADKEQARKLIVFFDGTRSNEESYTNISKLYNLVSLQNDPKIAAIYLRGVGNGADMAGMLLGSGLRKEVSKAYLFLAENYDHARGDKIFLFGFSRGAYAARMLAGFIYSAGIVELNQVEGSNRQVFVRKMFDAHKGQKTIEERRTAIRNVSGQELNTDEY